ncbi:Protein kinase domain [Carpediemonas membranifera]|uniref:Protein kinase domain n=1 Tax=Carpediemonas membranifera TaxID=201153 RepID=A0A8J6AXH3_9EUKA|nr:Protein kinase domain [Carpediemonas membranifera]|eukprot:KAG9396568.1 Protein kinase domain [Carpediemonas membranifera]
MRLAKLITRRKERGRSGLLLQTEQENSFDSFDFSSSSSIGTPLFDSRKRLSTLDMTANNVTITTRAVVSVDEQSGRRMVNQYIIGRTVGIGAFAKVKTVLERPTGLRYAAKIIDRRELARKGQVSAHDPMDDVYNEILVLGRIQHDHVPTLHEVIDDPSVSELYYIMDLIEGETMHVGTTIGLAEGRALVRDIAGVLRYLHGNQIVHGDVKPDNIVHSDGRFILLDFGTSRTINASSDFLVRTVGTQAFMAPEMTAEDGYNGKTADVWALGVTLFTLVYGALPFDGDTLADLLHDIETRRPIIPPLEDPLLVDLLHGLLAKDPMHRLRADQVLWHPWVKRQRPSSLRKFHLKVQLEGRSRMVRDHRAILRRRSVISLSPVQRGGSRDTFDSSSSHLSLDVLTPVKAPPRPRHRTESVFRPQKPVLNRFEVSFNADSSSDGELSDAPKELDVVRLNPGTTVSPVPITTSLRFFATPTNRRSPSPVPRKPSIVSSVAVVSQRLWGKVDLESRLRMDVAKTSTGLVFTDQGTPVTTTPLTARRPVPNVTADTAVNMPLPETVVGAPASDFGDSSSFQSDSFDSLTGDDGIAALSDVEGIENLGQRRLGFEDDFDVASVSSQSWSEMESGDDLPDIMNLLLNQADQIEIMLMAWNSARKPPYCMPKACGV